MSGCLDGLKEVEQVSEWIVRVVSGNNCHVVVFAVVVVVIDEMLVKLLRWDLKPGP